jgi:hypothetical protein
MASATKIQTAIPSARTAIENRPQPPPTKRRSLVPAPLSYSPPTAPQYTANVNNSKEQHSALIGQPSEATCCFFKRKAKRALQITSTTRKT